MPIDGAHPPPGDIEELELFGFDEPRDAWLDKLRVAETSFGSELAGGYELIEEVGRGGQGVVFRAVQPGTRRQIAVKRVLAGQFASSAMRQRFEREVEVLTSLNHPNVVTIFAADFVDGVPLLAMEWIDGVPITRWRAHERGFAAGVRDRIEVFLQACDAVVHAHQRGIIHRDLKPSNILVDKNGRAHVLDFGVAKLTDAADSARTSCSHFIGTLSYASPEQLLCDGREIDVRSDVYSLGVVLYEILAGHLPYDLGEGVVQAARTLEKSRPLPLSKAAQRVDADLEAVVMKALAREKPDRYQSADALAADLRAWLAGELVSARGVRVSTRLLRTVRRYRMAIAGGAVALILVMAFALTVAVLAARLAEQRDLAVAAGRNEAAARRHAELEEAKSSAVSGFLEEMLATADPQAGSSSDLTVRAVLDSAAMRLESQPSVDPSVELKLRTVIGKAYQSLAQAPAAEAQFRAALTLCDSAGEDEARDRLILLTELGTALHVQGRHAEAGEITQEAVQLYRTALAEGQPLTDVDVSGPIAYLVMSGRPDEAEALLRDTLAVHREILGEHHPVIADDMLGLSSLLRQLGDLEEAFALAREGVERLRQRFGDEHPEVAKAVFSLGVVYQELGELASAEEAYRESLTVLTRPDANSEATAADLYYQYARLLEQQERYAEAADAYRASRELHVAVYGESHPGVFVTQACLGGMLRHMGRTDEANVLLEEALVALRPILPEGHRRIAQIEGDLGACLSDLGELEKAEPLLLSSLAVRQELHGAKHDLTRETAHRLATLYERWGRPDLARQYREPNDPSPEE